MRMLSLFSGIGGLDLGLEWAGMQCVAQVECEPFPLAVLEKHWPHVKRYTDVREITGEQVTADVGPIDCIAGGFPCQDISAAGKQAGIEHGARSGLWREYARLVRELLPRWVVVENVSNLRNHGADIVLGDLEAAGYHCWPCVVGVDNLRGPHRRKRAFILARRAVADTDDKGSDSGESHTRGSDARTRAVCATVGGAVLPCSSGAGDQSTMADADDTGCDARRPVTGSGDQGTRAVCGTERGTLIPCSSRVGDKSTMADADDSRRRQDRQRAEPRTGGPVEPPRHRWTASDGEGHEVTTWGCWPAPPGAEQYPWEEPRSIEREVGGATYGFPKQFPRWRNAALKALGNAVSPQVAAYIGGLVMQLEAENGSGR